MQSRYDEKSKSTQNNTRQNAPQTRHDAWRVDLADVKQLTNITCLLTHTLLTLCLHFAYTLLTPQLHVVPALRQFVTTRRLCVGLQFVFANRAKDTRPSLRRTKQTIQHALR